jgi:hypothetical protein
LSSLNCVIWDSICRRLRCKVDFSSVDLNRARFSGTFCFTDQPFCGILSHMTAVCGGNVHERGIIEITCSSTGGQNCWRVADHNWTSHWYSDGEANSWICFNFKSRHLQLQHYTIKSANGGCYSTDWVIEGSRDGSVWIVLDVRQTDDLAGPNIVQTFSCSSSESASPFHFIRWRMTEKRKSRPGERRCCHSAKLCNIEFFGVLSRSSSCVNVPQ